MNTSSSDIKGLPDSNNRNPILKRLIRISDTMGVVPIPDSVIKKLHIDEECTWFEVIPTSEGILLKISLCSDSLALPKIGKGL
jgi:hypothetical protein